MSDTEKLMVAQKQIVSALWYAKRLDSVAMVPANFDEIYTLRRKILYSLSVEYAGTIGAQSNPEPSDASATSGDRT
jgi:hypothetical protein